MIQRGNRLQICCPFAFCGFTVFFDRLPLLPQPVANGLTSISRANCLSVASFRTADVHLFGTGYPRSGQGIGAHFSAYSFYASKKSKATSGDATPGLVY